MSWQQGDHEGRPYMVCLLCLKCRGDPRGRPQEHSLCKNRTRTPFLAGRKQAFLVWSGACGIKCSSVFSLDILVNICYTPLMKTTLTAKLKLHPTPEQFQALRTTQLVYRDALRTVLIRQDWMSTGRLSVGPDVSSEEAKAARLQRYAELRWSLDISPRASAGGD